eukprot:66509-Lingulodinium_polyedra.AAC.1
MSASGSSPAPLAPIFSSDPKGVFCSGITGNGAIDLCAFARGGVDAGLRVADMELGLLVCTGPCGTRTVGGFVRLWYKLSEPFDTISSPTDEPYVG